MDESKRKVQVSENQGGFKKEIGVFGGVSIIGGIMIGSGIFYIGSIVLQRTNMSLGAALLCWIIGGVVSLLGGMCFAELGASDPLAGGKTIYLSKAFHPFMGFADGFCSWLVSNPASIAGVAIATDRASLDIQLLWRQTGVDFPKYYNGCQSGPAVHYHHRRPDFRT